MTPVAHRRVCHVFCVNLSWQLFYPLYIVFEVPSNMLLIYLRPSLYLPALMFLWGKHVVGPGLAWRAREKILLNCW